jgi:hypothetical protein
LSGGPYEGWPPRLAFVTYAVWIVVLATHLARRFTPPGPPADRPPVRNRSAA